MGAFSFFHLVVVLILLVPALFVIFSSKVHGYEKLGWAVVSLFLSWVGFVAFLIVTANRPNLAKSG